MISERILSRTLVGRAAELEHLRACRRLAGEGNGRVVLIGGTAGVGKSRLVRDFRTELVPRFTQVATAACREFAQRPLEPLADILAQLEPRADPLGLGGLSKSEQLGAVLHAFAGAGQHRTAVLIIEDLHWADIELVQTLSVLAAHVGTQRLLFACTYRDDEIGPAHALFRSFGRLMRHESVSLMRLHVLDASDTSALLKAALGDRAVLAPNVMRDIARRSGGNPLFAEELLRHVVDEQRGGGVPGAQTLPISLQAVIRERLDRCTVAQRALLNQASLFGRYFDVELLGEVFGITVADQIDLLRGLRELQLIDAVEGTSALYAFRHALTRDVVYGDMLPAETRPFHLRIAEAIEKRPDADARAEDLAHNFWEAGRLDRAAPFCERAADAAGRLRHAHEDAALWYERAAAAFAHSEADAARVLAKAGDALVRADAIDRSLDARARAVAAYLRLGDVPDAVAIRLSMIGTLANDGRANEAVALAHETIALVSPGEHGDLRDKIFVRLAVVLAAIRRSDEAWDVLDRVDEAGMESPSQTSAEYFLARSALLSQRAAPQWRASVERTADILDRFSVRDDIKKTMLGSLAVQALNVGEMALARTFQGRSVELARRVRIDEHYALAMLAEIELRCGNVAAARDVFATVGPAQEFLPRAMRAHTGAQLGVVLGDMRLLEECVDLDLLEEAYSGGSDAVGIQLGGSFAPALAALGRHDEALVVYERTAAAIHTPFACSGAIAAIALNQPHLAGRLRSLVAAHAARPADRVNKAMSALIEAAVARENGDSASLTTHASDAAVRFRELGWHLLEAQSLELAGQSRNALALYHRLGCEADARRLKRRGAGAHSSRLAALTARERELAMLVGSGSSNRAAASALSVAEKTVEKHLTEIYAKLGVGSRTQLAAFIAAEPAGPQTARRDALR